MHRRVFSSLLLALMLSAASAPVFAQSPDRPENLRVNIQNNTPVTGDFIVGPTRFLLNMAPGEERTVEVQLTNRSGLMSLFQLTTEDFAADPERDGTPTFYATDLIGPYPARLWITPEVDRFELSHGERAFLRVTVSVPEDADPGDHQAALIAERVTEQTDEGGFNIVSRVASLFIITVEGDVVKDGFLESLSPHSYLNWFYPVFLRLAAVNKGTVHMIPTGTVEIRNIFGIVVDEIPLRDWVILRNSRRTRDFEWAPRFALGRYTAVTNLTVFDGTPMQQLKTAFWVIPLLPVLIILLCIFLVSFLVQYFLSRFEITRKDSKESKEANESK